MPSTDYYPESPDYPRLSGRLCAVASCRHVDFRRSLTSSSDHQHCHHQIGGNAVLRDVLSSWAIKEEHLLVRRWTFDTLACSPAELTHSNCHEG